MSKALRCDKCKQCFVPEECSGTMVKFRNPITYTANDLQNKEAGPTAKYVFDIGPDGMADLCPACAQAFLEFMNQ